MFIPAYYNEFNQPIGEPVIAWQACEKPQRKSILGKSIRLEPLSASTHAEQLYTAYQIGQNMQDLTYLNIADIDKKANFIAYIKNIELLVDPLHFAIVSNSTNQAIGTFALKSINQQDGTIEVGWVIFSPLLEQTTMATEAHFLLLQYIFETLKYRRYEWQCDSLNAASQKAALRLGFLFEGILRQTRVYKGRNKDTAWFSILDKEWSKLKLAYLAWLDESNFDENGRQKISLKTLIEKIAK